MLHHHQEDHAAKRRPADVSVMKYANFLVIVAPMRAANVPMIVLLFVVIIPVKWIKEKMMWIVHKIAVVPLRHQGDHAERKRRVDVSAMNCAKGLVIVVMILKQSVE